MIRKLFLLCAVVLALIFASCGASGKAVADDISVIALAERLERSISNRALLESSSERYIKSRVSATVASVSAVEYVMKTSLSQICDEYGVVKAQSEEDADAICREINASLDRRRAEWDDRYYSEEKPKIFAAEARRFGVYVIYGVLAPSELEAVFEAAKNVLYNK